MEKKRIKITRRKIKQKYMRENSNKRKTNAFEEVKFSA